MVSIKKKFLFTIHTTEREIPCHFRSVPFLVNFREVAVLVRFQTVPVLSQGQLSVVVNGPDGKIKRAWSLIAQEFSVF